MNEIKIPKSFQLFGRTFQVVQSDDRDFRHETVGLMQWDEGVITLYPHQQGGALPRDSVEQVWFHELVHALLKGADDNDYDPPLWQREALVDRIASLMHQAMKTMEYEDDHAPTKNSGS